MNSLRPVTDVPMVVRLVATAGPNEGRGHVGRALALAEALGQAGIRARLQLVRGSLTALDASRAAGLGIEVLAGGVTDTDAATVVDLPDPNALVDHVDPRRLVVFDDTDSFTGRAAAVVQPSLPRWSGRGFAERVLSGYAYAPIAPAYRRLRSVTRPAQDPGDPVRVVVSFGGSDPARVGDRLAAAFAQGRGWHAELIVGASYAGRIDSLPVDVVRDPDDLPERLAMADLVVLGAGTMKFEAACLGRPAILLAVADDQVGAAPTYAGTGAARYLGDGRTIEPARVRDEIEALVDDPAARSELGRRAAALIDGRGADRIAEVVAAIAAAMGG